MQHSNYHAAQHQKKTAMPDNKTIDQMTPAELRNELNEYFQPAQRPLPMPAGAPQGLSEAQKDNLFNNWTNYINSRDPATWTIEEKQVIRIACLRALKEPGQ